MTPHPRYGTGNASSFVAAWKAHGACTEAPPSYDTVTEDEFRAPLSPVSRLLKSKKSSSPFVTCREMASEAGLGAAPLLTVMISLARSAPFFLTVNTTLV